MVLLVLLLHNIIVETTSTLVRPYQQTQTQHTFTVDNLKQTLDALEKLLTYFDENRGSLIVDSMWGIRMIQGGLENAVRTSDNDNDQEVLARVKKMSKYAADVSARGIFYAKRNAAVQFEKFSELLSQAFVYQNLLGGNLGRIDSELMFTQRSKLNIEPRESDDCLMGTIGSGPYKGSTCTITEKCWKQITDEGQREYSITHQLLFFFLIKHYNCTDSIEKRGGDATIAHFAQVFCTNIYREMEIIFDRGVDPGVDQDLIMEQIMFCGGAGFVKEFVRPDLLEMMLDWQRDDGCYAPYDGSHLPQAIELHSRRARERAIQNRKMVEIKNANNGLDQDRLFMMRKPLSEAELRDGCMMHMSSVAGGALTIYVNAILQHKLYTNFTPTRSRLAGVPTSTPETLIILFLCVLTLFVLIRTCSVPMRLFLRLASRCKLVRATNVKTGHLV